MNLILIFNIRLIAANFFSKNMQKMVKYKKNGLKFTFNR